MTVRVKICGITTVDDAIAAREAGAWAIGVNFFPNSPRYVVPERAADIVAAVPEVLCVGVFVNESRERVESIADDVGLGALQFHGDENPAYCRHWERPVVKAFRIRDAASVAGAQGFDVDFILADAHADGLYGGSGRVLPWTLLAEMDKARLILAGGLDPDNVADAVRAVRPYAVDVASGVEATPGRKDSEKIRRFVEHAIHA